MNLDVQQIDPDLPLPQYARPGDAGLDLLSTLAVRLQPRGGRAVVPTGIAVAIEPGHVGLVMPRSGLARDHGVTVLNGPGVIDSGYRGEIVVLLVNLDASAEYSVRRGDRIAQLVLVQ